MPKMVSIYFLKQVQPKNQTAGQAAVEAHVERRMEKERPLVERKKCSPDA